MKTNEYLSELICTLGSTPLTQAEDQEIRYKVLDWIGCAIAGAACVKPASVFQKCEQLSEGATIIGRSTGGTIRDAAFCNGFSASYLEFEDTHKLALSHPGGLNVAAALAVCEREKTSMAVLFRSIVAGYETMLRLGVTLNPSHYQHWHTTGTCGVFGAAAAACAAKGMSQESVGRAMGIAANMSSGFRFSFGTDAKTVNAAHPAMCGIWAADLAQSGLTAPDEILVDALLPLMTEEPEKKLFDQPAQSRLWLNCAYKSYASCGHTHTALDCWTVLMRGHGFHAKDVASAEVVTFPVAVSATGKLQYAQPVEARFSLPYCLAAATVLGSVTPGAFTEEARKDQRILGLAARIAVKTDQECADKYPSLRPANVTIRLKDGRVLREARDMSVTNPPREALRAKYHGLADPVIGRAAAEQIEAVLLYGDTNRPVGELCRMLRSAEFAPQPY